MVLNAICASIATHYQIPFFLDSVGVFLTTILLGPLGGAIVGTVMDIFFGAYGYIFASVATAFVVGYLLHDNDRIDSFRVISTGFLAGIVTSLLAAPFNIAFNQGYTWNIWGDALVDLLSQSIDSTVICCLAGEFIVNIPDKLFTLIILMVMIKVFRHEGISITNSVAFRGEKNEKTEKAPEEKAPKGKSSKKISDLLKTKKLFKKEGGRFFALFLACALLIGTIAEIPAVAKNAEDKNLPGDAMDSGALSGMNFNAEYALNMYGADEGLNSAEINSITQTGDGYIWCGGYSGVYIYNGSYFEQIALDERITNALALYTDRKGRIWIGTNDNGVACYNPYSEALVFFTMDEGLPSNSIRDICEDENGNIYVSTASYLCRITFKSARNNAGGRVKTINENEDELALEDTVDYVVSTDLGKAEIDVYDDMEGIAYTYSLISSGGDGVCGVTDNGKLFIVKDDKLVGLLEAPDGNYLYIAVEEGTEEGTFLASTSKDKFEFIRFDGKNLVKTGEKELSGISGVEVLKHSDSFAGYFMGGREHIGFLADDGTFQLFEDSEFDSAVSDIVIDRQSNIWMSSTKQGVAKFSHNPFTDLFRKGGISERAVNAILLDGENLYIGTDTGVLKINKNTGKQVADDRLSIFDGDRVRNINKDSKGNLWFSTYGDYGLVKYSPAGDMTSFTSDTSAVLGSRFRFTLELSNGEILAASSDGVSFIKGGNVIATIGSEDGLVVPKVLAACEENDGSLWIGTDGGGVYTLEDGKVKGHFGSEEGLKSEVVMKIVPCIGGRIYVASNGLYYHANGKRIRKLTHFPYNNNYDVLITADHLAFISSSAGLFVVDEAELIDDDHDYSYALLNKKRGLTTTFTSNSWNVESEKMFYLCCADGVRTLNLKDYADFDSHYQIVLRSIAKDGEPVPSANGGYNIPAGAGQVTILPAILNYTVSDPLVHVELEGVDEEGITTRQSELDEIYYSDIPFGNYILKVQVLDDTAEIVKKEMTFLIHKDAKLYERLYYKVYLYANILLLLLFIGWSVSRMGNMAVINRQYDQIREAKEDAELANRAKSKFLAQMSHEIRTPINAVLGMDEMILRESREPDIRGYAADIYTAGNTLLSLINDILDSSKIESGKMEIVPVKYELGTLVHDLVNMITQRAQAKDLRLEVEVDPDLPKVLFGDDVRVRQVITNILTNAVKYTPEGTVWLRFSGSRVGETLNMHVEVEDTGIGIKEEDLPKLFEAYQRIEEGRNRKIEGTGLGITITVQLLRLMGSRLEVSSIYGKGSKFYFDLPQKIVDGTAIGDFDPTSSRVDNFFNDKDAFTAEEAKVLVVDDNAMNRKVFRSLLKRTKVQIAEAAGGREALAKVEWEHYDIIFMDHMMPEMDGVEAMKIMRTMECCNGIPIYVLTANAVTGAKEEYLAMGFDGFIAKPVAVEKLEEALRESLPDEMKHPLTEEELSERSEEGRGMPALPGDLPDVEGLDWNYAWLHLPEEGMLREGVESFYDVIELQADQLQEFYDELAAGGDESSFLDSYRIQVHGMKSAAATIGIVPLAGMAKVLEFAARDGKRDVVMSMHETFVAEWRSYEDKLRGVFGLGLEGGSGENGEDASPVKPAGDAGLLHVMFDMLAPAMEDLDVDMADDIMLKMKSYTFGEELDGLVKKLNGAVKNLDEELANKIMDEMRSLL